MAKYPTLVRRAVLLNRSHIDVCKVAGDRAWDLCSLSTFNSCSACHNQASTSQSRSRFDTARIVVCCAHGSYTILSLQLSYQNFGRSLASRQRREPRSQVFLYTSI